MGTRHMLNGNLSTGNSKIKAGCSAISSRKKVFTGMLPYASLNTMAILINGFGNVFEPVLMPN